jgi:predicted AlkP superfamily pyrophosphatase or phosphodiesterase
MRIKLRTRPVGAMLGLILVLALAPSVVGAMNWVRASPSRSAPSGVNHAPVPRYLVLMVLDGGRPDYFGLTHLPHVDALRAHGVQYTKAMDGILESETPAGHTTISTGSTPRRDGILGFDWAQNDNDFSLFSPSVVRSGAMEHIMKAAHVPTIAGLYKHRFRNAKVVAVSGHKYYAADPLGGPAADAIMYYQGDPKGHYVPVAIPGHVPARGVLNTPGLRLKTTHLRPGQDNGAATKLALAAFRKMHQRITLINYPEFDWPLGHVDGGIADRSLVVTLMRDFDRDLGKIENAYRKAHILKKTLFVITADHGMAITKRFVSQDIVNRALAQVGTTASSASYNSGSYIWLRNPSKAKAAAQDIVRAGDPGIQSVYYLTTHKGKATYRSAGGSFFNSTVDAANKYLLATLINGHQPNLVIFCRAWATMASPTTHWKADHGGANWESQHIPLIFSGPGIRQGVIVDGPAQLDDVAPTALQDMGVSPSPMEGRALADALEQSSPAARARRAAEIKRLQPLSLALIAQTAYDRSHE